MTIDSAHLRYAAPAASVAAPARAAARTPLPETATAEPVDAARVDTITLSIPAVPQPDVLEEMAAAAERAAELAQENRELHLRADEHSNRIIIEVRDMSGNVIRTIPPSKALDLMTTSPGRENQWVA